MDGDSRGGAALSVFAVSGRPIKYVGTGEAMEALEPFYPDRTATRVLGEPGPWLLNMQTRFRLWKPGIVSGPNIPYNMVVLPYWCGMMHFHEWRECAAIAMAWHPGPCMS